MADCVNWDDDYCSAARINIDDEGVCLTYSTIDDNVVAIDPDEEWDIESDEEEDLIDLDEDDDDDDDDDDDVVLRGRKSWSDW
ncbi:MAG: hypothetical protein KDI55_01355 [Anaerolineae bacterium]|nr:hypothetical protein [Anaerolineae bacterium]MCB0252354.1 hypothetical protein [Anaerolineae bacterium]